LPAASAALALLARDRLPPGRGRPRHLSLLQILHYYYYYYYYYHHHHHRIFVGVIHFAMFGSNRLLIV